MFLFSDRWLKSKTKIRVANRAELIVWIIVAASLLPTRPAQAYIDPGSGSLIIQIIVGAFFGAAYILKRFWGNITGWFKGRKKDKDKQGS